jgi:hypothetical protein
MVTAAWPLGDSIGWCPNCEHRTECEWETAQHVISTTQLVSNEGHPDGTYIRHAPSIDQYKSTPQNKMEDGSINNRSGVKRGGPLRTDLRQWRQSFIDSSVFFQPKALAHEGDRDGIHART